MARWSVAIAAPVASARGASHSKSCGCRRAGLVQMAAWSFRMSRGAPSRVTLSGVEPGAGARPEAKRVRASLVAAGSAPRHTSQRRAAEDRTGKRMGCGDARTVPAESNSLWQERMAELGTFFIWERLSGLSQQDKSPRSPDSSARIRESGRGLFRSVRGGAWRERRPRGCAAERRYFREPRSRRQ